MLFVVSVLSSYWFYFAIVQRNYDSTRFMEIECSSDRDSRNVKIFWPSFSSLNYCIFGYVFRVFQIFKVSIILDNISEVK